MVPDTESESRPFSQALALWNHLRRHDRITQTVISVSAGHEWARCTALATPGWARDCAEDPIWDSGRRNAVNVAVLGDDRMSVHRRIRAEECGRIEHAGLGEEFLHVVEIDAFGR
jgi:hypothetical protein